MKEASSRLWRVVEPNPCHVVVSVLVASSGLANFYSLQDGAPKIAKLVYKWLNYGLW